MSLNKVTMIGNVGTDPEMRYTPSGSAVTDFRLAVSRRFSTRDGNQQEETEWFTVTAWERLADTVNQYVTKGMKVYVEGRLKSRSYQGNDGQMRFSNEINAQTVLFLDRGGAAQQWNEEQGGGTANAPRQEAPPDPAGSESPSDVEELPW
ncbi:MAG: single-stranded DNA-binding protein [Dehalococcoidia bacterium]|jgi:single-strand DNA-binding protein|tara:strand:+ start:1019 stop:1468 length:450 start_codon:yes stop_codon:yes gene_type:complete